MRSTGFWRIRLQTLCGVRGVGCRFVERLISSKKPKEGPQRLFLSGGNLLCFSFDLVGGRGERSGDVDTLWRCEELPGATCFFRGGLCTALALRDGAARSNFFFTLPDPSAESAEDARVRVAAMSS